MDELIQALQAINGAWRVPSAKSLCDDARLAKNVLGHSGDLFGKAASKSIDDATAREFAKTINHICATRCRLLESVDGSSHETNARTVCVFMYVIESQLRLALAQTTLWDTLDDGTTIGAHNARVTKCPFDPEPSSEICQKAHMAYISKEKLDDEAINQMAFCTCFEDSLSVEKDRSWETILLFECLTAHTWAGLVLGDVVRALPLDGIPPDDENRAVNKWHETVIEAQHTDEFMSEITDRLLWSNMFEFEAQAPETQRVFRDAKPRKGYHWYTRLRAFRDGDLCNTLYNACNLRTNELAENLKAQTLLSYIEYHMRHAGVASWIQTSYVDHRYPKEALAKIEERRRIQIGQPNFPPFVAHLGDDLYAVVECGAKLKLYARAATLHEAFFYWTALVMERLDGMIAPRVSCAALIERIVSFGKTREDTIDVQEAFKRTSHILHL